MYSGAVEETWEAPPRSAALRQSLHCGPPHPKPTLPGKERRAGCLGIRHCGSELCWPGDTAALSAHLCGGSLVQGHCHVWQSTPLSHCLFLEDWLLGTLGASVQSTLQCVSTPSLRSQAALWTRGSARGRRRRSLGLLVARLSFLSSGLFFFFELELFQVEVFECVSMVGLGELPCTWRPNLLISSHCWFERVPCSSQAWRSWWQQEKQMADM